MFSGLRHLLPTGRHAHHFFAAISFITSISRSASATRLLSAATSALRRRAGPCRAAGGDRLLEGVVVWRSEIEDLERAVTVAAIDPAAIRRNTIGPRFIVVHRAVRIKHDANEAAQRALPLEAVRVDDL